MARFQPPAGGFLRVAGCIVLESQLPAELTSMAPLLTASAPLPFSTAGPYQKAYDILDDSTPQRCSECTEGTRIGQASRRGQATAT